ncbi:MAG: hypothetical protein ACK56I_27460, partial [bacterium]
LKHDRASSPLPSHLGLGNGEQAQRSLAPLRQSHRAQHRQHFLPLQCQVALGEGGDHEAGEGLRHLLLGWAGIAAKGQHPLPAEGGGGSARSARQGSHPQVGAQLLP